MPPKKHLKDKEAKQLLREFTQRYPSSESLLGSGREVEEQEVGENSIFFLNGKPLILRTKFGLLPSLKFDEFLNVLPRIIVDMGAVSHLVNGANVMRPGIRDIRKDFSKGDLLVIADEKFGKSIALGQADMDSSAMKTASKGKVIANLHYVGDELWKSFTEGQAT